MILRRIFNLLPWFFLLAGTVLIGIGFSASAPVLTIIASLVGGLCLLLAGLLIWSYLRPNRARLNPALSIESWDVVKDEMHNSNTDLIHADGTFYLVHAVSPYHFGDISCHLKLLRSPDACSWQPLARINASGEDIRDPKLAFIAGKLFLYVLVNRSFDPEPYTTAYTCSEDGGFTWAPLTYTPHQGWLFWKPKTRDGLTWYAAAYWHQHGKSALFSTQDGETWRQVAIIHAGGLRNDETDFEFLPDGSLLCTARLEGDFKEWGFNMFFGDPSGGTLISIASPPYTEFRPQVKSALTRLDGPALFSWGGRVFAVGRYQPELGEPFLRQGSIFARKRTSLFEVTSTGLTWLSDVPSAGDTAYAGVALHNGSLYMSYYTSPVERDFPWIVGMFNPSAIRLVRMQLHKLLR